MKMEYDRQWTQRREAKISGLVKAAKRRVGTFGAKCYTRADDYVAESVLEAPMPWN